MVAETEKARTEEQTAIPQRTSTRTQHPGGHTSTALGESPVTENFQVGDIVIVKGGGSELFRKLMAPGAKLKGVIADPTTTESLELISDMKEIYIGSEMERNMDFDAFDERCATYPQGYVFVLFPKRLSGDDDVDFIDPACLKLFSRPLPCGAGVSPSLGTPRKQGTKRKAGEHE